MVTLMAGQCSHVHVSNQNQNLSFLLLIVETEVLKNLFWQGKGERRKPVKMKRGEAEEGDQNREQEQNLMLH